MKIPFTRFGEVCTKVSAALENNTLAEGEVVSFQLDAPKANYLDLFVMGRLLSLVKVLSERNIATEFVCDSRLRRRKLDQLGLPAYCSANGIGCWEPEPLAQMELDGRRAEPLSEDTYWRCLIPLTPLRFEPVGSEEECIACVTETCSMLAQEVTERLPLLGLDAREMYPELALIFFQIAKELLGNAVTHGDPEHVVVALTLSREVAQESRPHRPNSPVGPGQDRFELMVLDLGDGVMQTLSRTLNPDGSALLDGDYFKPGVFRETFSSTRAKEQSLLENLFRGDLVVRKGRKSEGLHDLGRTLSWFVGSLNYFTGRTELQVTSQGRGAVSCTPRPQPDRDSYHLRGVIASPVLYSHHAKLASLRARARRAGLTGMARQPTTIERFPAVPEGFFGRTPAALVNRKSEMDAEAVITEYERLAGGADPGGHRLWEIDLKMSENLDLGYLDNFIQEICKHQARGNNASRLLLHLVFTNVPRDVINALRLRNCNSFLMLNNAYCLMLDGNDEPHLLGLPRVSRRTFDVEDALQFCLAAGTVTVSALRDALNPSPAVIDHLLQLVPAGEGGIATRRQSGGETVITTADLRAALRRTRARHLPALMNVRVSEGSRAAFRLANGQYVDSIYDFCLYWSDGDVVLDCARLLLAQHRFPVADTLVAFMNNGDRLAAALQRLTGVSTLIIADPHKAGSWENLEVSGRCVVVVDALYDGDERQGYVRELVQRLSPRLVKGGRRSRVAELIAFCDFRTPAAGEPQRERGQSSRLVLEFDDGPLEVEVRSIDLRDAGASIRFPRAVRPHSGLRLLRNYRHYILPKPQEERRSPLPFAPREAAALGSRPQAGGWQAARSTEMTTEFWQNVASVGLIDTVPTGRENRRLVFYEYTERLVRHPRMRRIVARFVSQFVRSRLNSSVDVILHPIHPIGAFTAQFIASQLSRPPLILPLTQRVYGETIEIPPDDYAYFRRQVEALRHERGRPLTAVVLDDSVLSGRSLFMMLGVAANLGLVKPHVFVLVNRLPAEVSEAVWRACASFTYLYRLNMPYSGETPDSELRKRNIEVFQHSNSYFGQYWATRLHTLDIDTLAEQRYFPTSLRGDGDEDEELAADVETELDEDNPGPMHLEWLCNQAPAAPPTVHGAWLRIVARNPADTHKLRQVLDQLILHPDGTILNFKTRLAVAANFLEQLVEERAFWMVLRQLVKQNVDREADTQSIPFVAAMVYLLAFSNHIHPYLVYGRFERLCRKIVSTCMASRDRWLRHSGLVSECLMALGVIGSERLWDVGAAALNEVIGRAMDDEGTVAGDVPEAGDPARDIIGAFAWSVQLLVKQKGPEAFATPETTRRWAEKATLTHGSETHLVLIDVLEPMLAHSAQLRERLDITQRAREDQFLEEIRSDPEVQPYLAKAPGYTCTLKTILRVTGASTILLYMGNEPEDYFLRALETQRNRPDDSVKPESLPASALPPRWHKRMGDQLFFCSEDPAELARLDIFNKGGTHTWAIGGAVNIYADDEMRYYVVLGFAERKPTRRLLSTSFYYWLQCESLLRDILPEIHHRHVGSSSAWNTLIQSIGPIHPIVLTGNTDSRIYKRRSDLRLAMASVNVSELVRRAVGLSSATVCSLSDIRARVSDIMSVVRQALLEVAGRYPMHRALLDELAPWPVMSAPRQRPASDYAPLGRGAPGKHIRLLDEAEIFVAFHLPVLEFICYEMLCNTFSYFGTAESITIDMGFRAGEVDDDGITGVWVDLTIGNDLEHSLKSAPDQERSRTGVHACQMAAKALGGSFEPDPVAGRRVSTARLPAYRVPNILKERLRAYLT
jgi:hypothetical protein